MWMLCIDNRIIMENSMERNRPCEVLSPIFYPNVTAVIEMLLLIGFLKSLIKAPDLLRPVHVS